MELPRRLLMFMVWRHGAGVQQAGVQQAYVFNRGFQRRAVAPEGKEILIWHGLARPLAGTSGIRHRDAAVQVTGFCKSRIYVSNVNTGLYPARSAVAGSWELLYGHPRGTMLLLLQAAALRPSMMRVWTPGWAH